MYYFKSFERPISNLELSEIEKKINVILPEDYKEFILKVNVGIPKEQYLRIGTQNIKWNFHTIHLSLERNVEEGYLL